MALAFHPLADLFPLIEGEELRELAHSIHEHGLREPIVLFEDKILDGRNRFRACEIAKVAPVTVPFDGTDALAFVIDKNIHRRHLNESQRALIAARLTTTSWGGARKNKACEQAMTSNKAAKLFNVGRDSVTFARKILDEGTPAEIAAVQKGEARVASLGRALRDKLPPKARRKAMGEAVSDRGRNPERIQKLRLNAEIWGRVREALTHLTSLPLAGEVAVIVRNNDKAGLVDQRLDKARKWLEEFSHVWHGHDQTAV